LASGKRLITGRIISVGGFSMKISKLLGWVAFGFAVAGFVTMLPDIKRYIRITTM
jgi:hypothetical protein